MFGPSACLEGYSGMGAEWLGMACLHFPFGDKFFKVGGRGVGTRGGGGYPFSAPEKLGVVQRQFHVIQTPRQLRTTEPPFLINLCAGGDVNDSQTQKETHQNAK